MSWSNTSVFIEWPPNIITPNGLIVLVNYKNYTETVSTCLLSINGKIKFSLFRRKSALYPQSVYYSGQVEPWREYFATIFPACIKALLLNTKAVLPFGYPNNRMEIGTKTCLYIHSKSEAQHFRTCASKFAIVKHFKPFSTCADKMHLCYNDHDEVKRVKYQFNAGDQVNQ